MCPKTTSFQWLMILWHWPSGTLGVDHCFLEQTLIFSQYPIYPNCCICGHILYILFPKTSSFRQPNGGTGPAVPLFLFDFVACNYRSLNTVKVYEIKRRNLVMKNYDERHVTLCLDSHSFDFINTYQCLLIVNMLEFRKNLLLYL